MKRTSRLKITPAQLRRNTFIFIGLGVFILTEIFLGSSGWGNSLDCQRVEASQVACVVQTRRLGLLPPEEQTISRLQGASLEPTCVAANNRPATTEENCPSRISLVAPGGVVNLPSVPFFSGGVADKEAIVQQINAFINTPTMLTLQTGESQIGPATVVMGLLLLSGLILFGVNISRLFLANGTLSEQNI